MKELAVEEEADGRRMGSGRQVGAAEVSGHRVFSTGKETVKMHKKNRKKR